MNGLSGIVNLLSGENRSQRLKFICFTEKFDTIEKSHYKDWVLRPNGK